MCVYVDMYVCVCVFRYTEYGLLHVTSCEVINSLKAFARIMINLYINKYVRQLMFACCLPQLHYALAEEIIMYNKLS